MTTVRIRRSTWTTYRTTGYSHQVGTDARATGGTHEHQVRRRRGGRYETRIVDSNGGFWSPGPATPVSREQGETYFGIARADR